MRLCIAGTTLRTVCSVALMVGAFAFGLSVTVAQEEPRELDYYGDKTTITVAEDDGPSFEYVIQEQKQKDAKKGKKQKSSGKKKSSGKGKQPPRPRVSPPTTPEPTAPTRRRRTRQTASSRSRSMSNLPEIFGDIFGTAGRLDIVTMQPGGQGPPIISTSSIDLITGGGNRRMKTAENNRSLPTDRIIFQYNHFHNAGSFVTSGAPPTNNQFPIDRYVFGVEKTFFDEQWSLEVRLPFTGFNGAGGVGPAGPTAVDGGTWGNVNFILKHILREGDTGVLAAGVAVDVPTGSDTVATIGASQITLENQAYHVAPYIGMSLVPTEDSFIQFFAQVDFTANGNDATLNTGSVPLELGSYNEQNLLYLDLAVGHWLFQDPDAERITGLAGIVELHYTTALQDTDAVTSAFGNESFLISSSINRFDVLNLTAGLHLEVAETSMLRVAAVVPLTGSGLDNRFFDAEIQAVFNRRF